MFLRKTKTKAQQTKELTNAIAKAERSGGSRRTERGKASAYFAVAIHRDVRKMDESVSASGGAALFGNDDGYIVAPPNLRRRLP